MGRVTRSSGKTSVTAAAAGGKTPAKTASKKGKKVMRSARSIMREDNKF